MLVIEEGRLGFTPALWVMLRLAMVQPVLSVIGPLHSLIAAAQRLRWRLLSTWCRRSRK
jgi:hypothetical protein